VSEARDRAVTSTAARRSARSKSEQVDARCNIKTFLIPALRQVKNMRAGKSLERAVPRQSWLLFAFVANFLVVGLPYWLIPYNKVNLPSALMEWRLLLVGFSALLVCACKVTTFWKATCILAASVPAVVLARVIIDAVKDPTSHNLWPLELVIALLVGVLCTLPGSIAGSLVAKVRT
jgi:hypothetical protein